VIGMDMKKETDSLKEVYVASTHDNLMLFTNLGRCYWLKVWQIPESGRRTKGKPIINLIESLAQGEKIAAVLRVRSFEEEGCILLATTKGVVKKSLIAAYSNQRKKGVNAIKLDEGDNVMAAHLVHENEQIMLFTRNGMAVRFDASLARPLGRVSRGVKGVTLKSPDDKVIACEVVTGTESILVVCEHGYGKRSKVEGFRQTNRGGVGVRSILTSKRNGLVIGAIRVEDDDGALLMSLQGQTLRLKVEGIRVMGRSTQGVRLVRLPANDKLIGMQKLEAPKEVSKETLKEVLKEAPKKVSKEPPKESLEEELEEEEQEEEQEE